MQRGRRSYHVQKFDRQTWSTEDFHQSQFKTTSRRSIKVMGVSKKCIDENLEKPEQFIFEINGISRS